MKEITISIVVENIESSNEIIRIIEESLKAKHIDANVKIQEVNEI